MRRYDDLYTELSDRNMISQKIENIDNFIDILEIKNIVDHVAGYTNLHHNGLKNI